MVLYMNKLAIADTDIVYLSFDEPNAEENYSDLLSKFPWAKRVHGVEGSDAAHKACADIVETNNFVTVDGDNKVSPRFFDQIVDFDKLNIDKSYVVSWCGKIHVNGLMYGNGGLKLWNKDFVYNMRTHEASEGDEKYSVEFCFDPKYFQLNENFSVSYTNATPWQAWRAGFREGVKMCLDSGVKVSNIKEIWWQNYHRLLVWCNIGHHTTNGIYSILGARAGLYKTMCDKWNYELVRDFRYLNKLFDDEYDLTISKAYEMSVDLGSKIYNELDIPVSPEPLSELQSKFFKEVYINTKRVL